MSLDLKLLLVNYSLKGSFSYRPNEDLKTKCNGPKDKGGVYLIFKVKDKNETLIYIGSSGQKDKKGNLKIRKGGLFDRLINGYHPNRFGRSDRLKRRKAFPEHMKNSNIEQINIYWWSTHDEFHTDFPTDVETILRNEYLSKHDNLPEWHKQ